MGEISYIGVIERYHEFRIAIHELMASILTGIASARMLQNGESQRKAVRCLAEHYPFVTLLYALDPRGVQTSDNLAPSGRRDGGRGKGRDRSQRPYFLLARDSDGVVVTEPYMSSDSRNLCISSAIKWRDPDQRVLGYVVLDIDLAKIVEFLLGDRTRRRFQPVFKWVYSLIAVGLFVVVAALLYSAYSEMVSLVSAGSDDQVRHLKPFGIIIFLTLALAIFDLGKTILEEEVLMHKDIFRHSSTRRTITRFIAAILIAVSIESLLLMFKSAMGEGEYLPYAVWMMLAAVGLMVGLGVYVFLGARAEVLLEKIGK